MDKYLAAAKALYEHNQAQLSFNVPWDDIKQAVRETYRKRAKVCIDAYEKDIAR